MKIAIDISSVIYGTGVSVYTKNLVGHLASLDKTNDYVLFGGSLRRVGELKDFASTFSGSLKGRLFPLAPKMLDILWNRMHIFPIERFIGGVDVYHSSDWAQAPSSAFKVTTIHDLVPLFYPELSHPRIVKAHTERLSWVKSEVDRVIVPSRTTAKDAIRFGISEDKIRIIPEAVDGDVKKASVKDIVRVKKRFGITKKYLLAVGTSHRKNLAGIISAFNMVKKKMDLRLVVVGERPGGSKNIDGVIYPGQVTDGDKLALYSGAEAFLYPSFYEGFGLPILEAYACKTPVVTSNFGSMKEVSKGASVLVDPVDAGSIASGIYKAIKERKLLVGKGEGRLKSFSWKKTARKTLKVYKEANI